jgi:hypothetical protein
MKIQYLVKAAPFLFSLLLFSHAGSAQSEDEELMMRPNPEELTEKLESSKSATDIGSKANDVDPVNPRSSTQLKVQEEGKTISNVKSPAAKGKEKMGLVIEDKKPKSMAPAGIGKQGMDGKEKMGIIVED